MSRRTTELPSDCSPPKKLLKEEQVHNETYLENDISSSSSYSTSDISMPKLPVQVMTSLFKFMSLRERLNASLVCKEWHEAASHPSYSHNEKLVFHGYQNCEELLKLLLKTTRKILLLEFRSCNLGGVNLLLLADKILYLSFFECQLNFALQIELLTKCVNLKEFYIKDGQTRQYPLAIPLPCFNQEIVKLLDQNNFRNENLKALSLNSFVIDLTAQNMQSIFKMFPNIRHFSFIVSSLSCYDNDDISSHLCFLPMQEIISWKHTLEDLIINPLEPQLRSLMLHDFTRLKRISLPIPDRIPEALIFNFFSRLKCLERISCSSCFKSRSSSFPTRFFEHLIRECSNLKRLKLKFPHLCYINLGREVFRALLSSKLTDLKILGANISTPDELFTTSTNFPANKTLQVLRIPTVGDLRIQCLLIQSFTNLRALHLGCYSGTILESIGQFQKNLTTLNLNMLQPDFTGIDERIVPASIWRSDHVYNCLQSFACLKNLYLDFPCYILFNCKFIPSSVKYLHLSFNDIDSTFNGEVFEHLILALKEKTELEGIYFATQDDRKIDLSMWSEICSSLNKLRFLIVSLRSLPSMRLEHYAPNTFVEIPETLFESCPSLRLFSRTSKEYYNLLHYDYVHRKMENVDYKSKMYDYITIDTINDSKIKFHMLGEVAPFTAISSGHVLDYF